MYVLVDIGNTNIVFALSSEDSILYQWRYDSRQSKAEPLGHWHRQQLQDVDMPIDSINKIIIASVVSDVTAVVVDMCQRTFGQTPYVPSNADLAGLMPIQVDFPEKVGIDRLLNCLAVREILPNGQPAIVVDFGTATKFDVLDAKGAFCGGVITVGAKVALDALLAAAPRLPAISITQPPKVCGTNSEDAVQSGIFWGYVGLIEGILTRLKAEMAEKGDVSANPTIIATGGLSSVFLEALPVFNRHEPDLTLIGLRLAAQHLYK